MVLLAPMGRWSQRLAVRRTHGSRRAPRGSAVASWPGSTSGVSRGARALSRRRARLRDRASRHAHAGSPSMRSGHATPSRTADGAAAWTYSSRTRRGVAAIAACAAGPAAMSASSR